MVLSFARPGALLIYHDTVAVRDVRHHWRKGAAAGLFAPSHISLMTVLARSELVSPKFTVVYGS